MPNGMPPGYQPTGNGSDMQTSRQIFEQILARQTQATGPITLNVSPAGGEGKSSVELTEGAKGDLRISIKVYSNDTTGASGALDEAIMQLRRWMEAKASFIPSPTAIPPSPPASETPTAAESLKPKKKGKEATE